MRRSVLALSVMIAALLLASGLALAATLNPVNCQVGVICNGTSGDDRIVGTSRADTMRGRAGNDRILGRDGNDRISGDAGGDTINGEGGMDIYTFANGWGTDTLSDTAGADTLNFSSVTMSLGINLTSTSDAEVNSADSLHTVNWSGDVVENITGGSNDDTIRGNAAANVMRGGSGFDDIYGGGGNDIIMLGADSGYADGEANDDTLIGGTGFDVLLDLAGGNDTYKGLAGANDFDQINDDSGTETLDLRAFDLSDATSWSTLDDTSDPDPNASWLQISFNNGGRIDIRHYFDSTSADDDASGPGAGCIETIVFADDTSVDFTQVQGLVP